MPNDTAPAWPDPARPGVPLNPEKDGWHWVAAADPAISAQSAPWWWVSDYQHWLPPLAVSGSLPLIPSRVQWRYLGLCLTPAEVAAYTPRACAHGRRDAGTDGDADGRRGMMTLPLLIKDDRGKEVFRCYAREPHAITLETSTDYGKLFLILNEDSASRLKDSLVYWIEQQSKEIQK